MSNHTSRRDATQRTPDEETPLLGRLPGKNSDSSVTVQRLKKHFAADVSRNWADLVLLFCYIITGLLDSSAVFIWGSFVSMQTGNTVYLGLGLIAPTEGIRWVKAGTSITSFCLGSFFFARFHRYFSPAKRWVLIVSYGFQLLLVVLAASIVTFGNDDSNELHWQVLVPLASVAFQSSGQAVTSRALKYNGLTSVVLTSNYCDLFSDPKLFALSNIERNRRIAAPLLLLLGACFGGLWAHSSVGLAGALWTAAALKLVAVIAWVFWKSEKEDE
ncbi:Nn.00g075190.m01.CDS01 [Neocucurbitaria sp. VM-36]